MSTNCSVSYKHSAYNIISSKYLKFSVIMKKKQKQKRTHSDNRKIICALCLRKDEKCYPMNEDREVITKAYFFNACAMCIKILLDCVVSVDIIVLLTS